MAVDPLSASKAYLDAAASALRAGGGGGGGPESAGGIDFGKLVQNALGDATTSMRQAEGAGMAAVSGKADIVNVVTAIAQAETTLETVMAVRDQVIQAYQEIMRMPI